MTTVMKNQKKKKMRKKRLLSQAKKINQKKADFLIKRFLIEFHVIWTQLNTFC